MIKKLRKSPTIIVYAIGLIFVNLVAHGRWLNYVGIGAEQYWIIQNLHKSFFGGFLYSDQSRPFLSLIFHLIFLFFGTSYQAVLYVNILLTVVIALQVYYVLKKMIFNDFYSLLAALLVVLSAGDTSTQLFSMLVVKQIVICSLGLVLVFLSVKKNSTISFFHKIQIVLYSLIGSYTYEVFIALVLVLVFYIILFENFKATKVYIGYVSGPVVIAIFQIVSRYFFEDSQSYQSQKFIIPDSNRIIQSTGTYIQGSLVPWTWVNGGFRQVFAECQSLIDSTIGIWPWLLSLSLTLASVILYIFKFQKSNKTSQIKEESRNIILFVFLLFGSYVPYFFVSDGNSNWRTQLLGQPFVIILLIFLLKIALNGFRALKYIAIPFFTLYLFSWSFFGVTSLQTDNLYFAKYWADHSIFFNSLVNTIPNFSEDAIILVVNVPSGSSYCPKFTRDPFEDNYWFQAGIHSYYPKSYDPKVAKVVGLYTHKTLQELSRETFEVSGNTVLNLIDGKTSIPMNKLIVLEYRDKKVQLIDQIKSTTGDRISDYQPRKLIESDTSDYKRPNLDIPVLEVFR